MIWLMFVFFVSAGPNFGSSTADAVFATKPLCEHYARQLTMEQLREESGIPTIHHFEARCLGFETPGTGTDT